MPCVISACSSSCPDMASYETIFVASNGICGACVPDSTIILTELLVNSASRLSDPAVGFRLNSAGRLSSTLPNNECLSSIGLLVAKVAQPMLGSAAKKTNRRREFTLNYSGINSDFSCPVPRMQCALGLPQRNSWVHYDRSGIIVV